jgi:hypothetical protein
VQGKQPLLHRLTKGVAEGVGAVRAAIEAEESVHDARGCGWKGCAQGSLGWVLASRASALSLTDRGECGSSHTRQHAENLPKSLRYRGWVVSILERQLPPNFGELEVWD